MFRASTLIQMLIRLSFVHRAGGYSGQGNQGSAYVKGSFLSPLNLLFASLVHPKPALLNLIAEAFSVQWENMILCLNIHLDFCLYIYFSGVVLSLD